jgi:hypothetical protein
MHFHGDNPSFLPPFVNPFRCCRIGDREANTTWSNPPTASVQKRVAAT